eukprot:14605569-Ditylum_brightwellii.AAC.1
MLMLIYLLDSRQKSRMQRMMILNWKALYIIDNFNIGDNQLENNEEVNNLQYKLSLTPAKEKFYAQMQGRNEVGLLAINSVQDKTTNKYGLVGSATGDSSKHTIELKVMTYDKAMDTPEKDEWEKSVVKEHDISKKYKVWCHVKKSMVLDGTKIPTST